MADQTTLMGLLKTPSQIRKESQDRMMEESLARSQMMLRGSTGGTTALPGIISAYGAQAAQRGTQAGAGLLRGVAGGIGQAVGGDVGQRISNLGVPVEERQAAMQQQALQGVDYNNVESILKTAKQLRDAGNIQAALALEERATSLEEQELKQNEARIKQFQNNAKLAKDFTTESLTEALESGDLNKLRIRDSEKASNYVVVTVNRGVDRNGQPITEDMLVDKNQVGELSNNAPIVNIKEFSKTQASQGAKETDDDKPIAPISTSDISVSTKTEADLPGIAGLSTEKNIEQREQALSEVLSTQLLIDDVFSNQFEEVAGITNWVARGAAKITDSDLAPIAQRMKSGAISRAIQVAGDLGVNPTDKDFEVALEAAPGPNDGAKVWRAWTEKQFVPGLKSALQTKFGKESPRVQMIIEELDRGLQQAKAGQQTTGGVVNWSDMKDNN